MYKILTGICCGLWGLMIAYNAWGLLSQQPDLWKAAELFTEEMPSEVTVTLRLGGSCSVQTEQDVPKRLEAAAGSLGITGGYAVSETQTEAGSLWELFGADENRTYSLNYLSEGGTAAVSFTVTVLRGAYKSCYSGMELLREEYGMDSMICVELSASLGERLDGAQIQELASGLLKRFGAAPVYSGEEDNLQIYYGYAEALGSYVTLSGEKANVNLMFRTNEKETRCLLGFPVVLSDD